MSFCIYILSSSYLVIFFDAVFDIVILVAVYVDRFVESHSRPGETFSWGPSGENIFEYFSSGAFCVLFIFE